MRGFALSPALAVAGMASASFDLVLITDSTNGLVYRIDGDRGTYLGSFGGGILADPRAIAIDQANNIAYVGDTSVGGHGRDELQHRSGAVVEPSVFKLWRSRLFERVSTPQLFDVQSQCNLPV